MKLLDTITLYIKKIIYYRDITFLSNIFISSFFISRKSVGAYLKNVELLSTDKNSVGPQKIIKYVGLCLYIRDKIGLGSSCFLSSMLLYKFLRRYGINSEIIFGVKQEGGRMFGHCWINEGDSSQTKALVNDEFSIILKHPNN